MQIIRYQISEDQKLTEIMGKTIYKASYSPIIETSSGRVYDNTSTCLDRLNKKVKAALASLEEKALEIKISFSDSVKPLKPNDIAKIKQFFDGLNGYKISYDYLQSVDSSPKEIIDNSKI